MKVGLALPHYDFSFPDGGPASWERLAAAARRAEELGFDSVWISDHFFLSLERYGGGAELFGSAEPLTALAGLATATERVRLGALVLCAGFRHPAILAKAATTIDLLSGGRLDLGMGAGWYEDEYRAFGYEFGTTGDRFEILEETVEVLVRLFGTDEPSMWEGRHFRLQEAFNRPRPVQKGGPPLWIGGKGGPRLLRLVARKGYGWNTVWAVTDEDYAKRTRALDEASRRADRDPTSVKKSVGLYTLVGESPSDLEARFRALQRWTPGGFLDGVGLEDWSRDKLVGTPEQIVGRMSRFAGLGVEEVIVSAASVPFAIYDDSMLDLMAESVLPATRDL
jgi:probable F420-dependent oxidoreductase